MLVHVTSATEHRAAGRYGHDVPPRDDEPTIAILTAARELLASEGQGALTVRRIAAAAGGSTMNVYSRFGGKDGVIDALIIEGFEMLCVEMQQHSEGVGTRADLAVCARAYRQFALGHRTHYELMFDRTIPGYEMSERAIEAASSSLMMLATRCEAAMDGGTIRRSDPLQTATIFWSACHGPVSLELRGMGKPGTDWNAVHHDLVARLLDGLRP